MVPNEIERSNLDTVRRGFAALASGDVHAFGNVFHPDAVWHVAPAGTLKGHYRGRDQIVGFLAHVLQETDGTFQGDPLAMAATGDRVLVQHAARATRNGTPGEWHSVLVFTLSDGAATSVHHYSIDYPAVARFWE
jgi:hypothetical protein